MKETVDKVLVYVLRWNASGSELLVFKHRDHPEAGIQVPAGTIDSGESAEGAAKRELMEESGLEADTVQLRGIYEYYREDIGQHQRRHVFVVKTDDRRDSWTHFVGGVGEDQGMAFHFFWQPLPIAADFLAGDQGKYLEDCLRYREST